MKIKTNVLSYEQFKKLYKVITMDVDDAPELKKSITEHLRLYDYVFYEPIPYFLLAIIDNVYKHGHVLLDEVFEKLKNQDVDFGSYYEILQKYTDIDFIGWQIDNNTFDWEKYSWCIIEYAPQHFDPQLFNWKDYSRHVEVYAPHLMKYCPKQYR